MSRRERAWGLPRGGPCHPGGRAVTLEQQGHIRWQKRRQEDRYSRWAPASLSLDLWIHRAPHSQIGQSIVTQFYTYLIPSAVSFTGRATRWQDHHQIWSLEIWCAGWYGGRRRRLPPGALKALRCASLSLWHVWHASRASRPHLTTGAHAVLEPHDPSACRSRQAPEHHQPAASNRLVGPGGQRASGTPSGWPGVRVCGPWAVGWGARRSRRPPTLGLSRPGPARRASPHPIRCSGPTWPGRCLASGPAGLRASCGPRSSPAGALSTHPAWPVPGAQPTGSDRRGWLESLSPAPSPYQGPLAPTPPTKHTTFLREQMSQRQAHGQTHRHSHAPTRRETAAGASSSARAIAPVRGQGQRNERMGGWLSGETEAERDEGSETHSKTVRGRYRQTDRDTCTQSHTHTHTHTYTHTQGGRDRERETERVTERRQTGDRQGREDGIWPKIDTLAQTVNHLRGRPHGRSSSPKGGGVSLGWTPAGWLDAVPWGWRSPWGPQDFLSAEVSKVPFSLAT